MMTKSSLCDTCGNHHNGPCSSKVTYFFWLPEGEKGVQNVEIVGSWHQWQLHSSLVREVDENGDVYFELQINLPVGYYEYKYLVNGQWRHDPNAPTTKDSFNSIVNYIEVLPQKASMSYCSKNPIKLTSSILQKNLVIVGSWDNWESEVQMKLVENTLKGCQENVAYIDLDPDKVYEFKFKLGPHYMTDDRYPKVPNDFGSLNNRIKVSEENSAVIKRKGSISSDSQPHRNQTNFQIGCRKFVWERVVIRTVGYTHKQRLQGHSICQIGDSIYIFGGRLRDDFTNRLTRVNIHKLHTLIQEQMYPQERAFHCAVSYGSKLIICGGHNQNILQDYAVFDSTTSRWQTPPEFDLGKPPSKRQKQSCVLYEHLLVFFGGYSCSENMQIEQAFNDIYVLDLEKLRWTQEIKIQETSEEHSRPPPRYLHTASLIGSKMYIFGGKKLTCSAGESLLNSPKKNKEIPVLNDLWAIDLKEASNLSWVCIDTQGKPPCPRCGHSSNALSDKLIIFGGEDQYKNLLNDVFVFDTISNAWIKPEIDLLNSQVPIPRAFHASVTINNEYIIVFGGKNKNFKSSTFYILRAAQ